MAMPAQCGDAAVSLSQLLPELGAAAAQIPVSGLAADSRRIRPGDIFLACCGANSHGMDYLNDAITRGAAAAVAEQTPDRSMPELAGIPLFALPGLRSRLGVLADRFYGPASDLELAGVTGTDGKSSSCAFLAQALDALGQPCGVIGSLGCQWGGVTLEETGLTTPDVLDLHRLLRRLRDQGAVWGVIEMSSHGLQQNRADGLHFRAALFTGLGADHLEYHGSEEAYLAAKTRLFSSADLHCAALNWDDPHAAQIASQLSSNTELVSWGTASDARMRARVLDDGVLRIDGDWGAAELCSSLPGQFNLRNLLGCAALLAGCGIPLPQAVEALQRVRLPPGRMQFLPNRLGVEVAVDYAHTAEALEQALRALRTRCAGRLWCLFGCGGERDRAKRPRMGAAAERWADRVVLSSDNPRGENPAQIIDEIQAGMHQPAQCMVIEDRGAALRTAIAALQPGDALLVAGRGHERLQEIAGQRRHFDDVQQAAACLRELENAGG